MNVIILPILKSLKSLSIPKTLKTVSLEELPELVKNDATSSNGTEAKRSIRNLPKKIYWMDIFVGLTTSS